MAGHFDTVAEGTALRRPTPIGRTVISHCDAKCGAPFVVATHCTLSNVSTHHVRKVSSHCLIFQRNFGRRRGGTREATIAPRQCNMSVGVACAPCRAWAAPRRELPALRARSGQLHGDPCHRELPLDSDQPGESRKNGFRLRKIKQKLSIRR